MSNSSALWTAACQAPLYMGILQERILELVAMSSSRGSSQPRDLTRASCVVGGFFTAEPEGKPGWSLPSFSSILSLYFPVNTLDRIALQRSLWWLWRQLWETVKLEDRVHFHLNKTKLPPTPNTHTHTCTHARKLQRTRWAGTLHSGEKMKAAPTLFAWGWPQMGCVCVTTPGLGLVLELDAWDVEGQWLLSRGAGAVTKGSTCCRLSQSLLERRPLTRKLQASS